MIEFLCPGGHRIRCADDQAGRGAKCPKCGAKFRIPPLSEAKVPDSFSGDSSVSQPELTDSGIGQIGQIGQIEPGGSGQRLDAQRQIEFLCPNGHHLHGPADLQGKPGECPECRSKFHIPSYDDVPEEEESGEGATELQISLSEADGQGGPAAAQPWVGRDEQASGSSFAQLFTRFWAEKARGATIELHLADGETLVPDRFAQSLSRQSHAAFSVKEADGTHTLTVLAWESVVRVSVRGVKDLPREMAD